MVAKAEQFVTSVVPAGHPHLRLVTDGEELSYAELAKLVGFDTTEGIRAELLDFFAEKKIRIYDYDQVHAWLVRQRQEARAGSWYWRPLRQRDAMPEWVWGVTRGRSSGWRHSACRRKTPATGAPCRGTRC